MAALSFSEFVALLYPYCGNGETEADFIVTITDRIMRGHPGRRNKVVNKEDMYQNPMRNKSVRTLQAYFKGNRPISKRDASILYAIANHTNSKSICVTSVQIMGFRR